MAKNKNNHQKKKDGVYGGEHTGGRRPEQVKIGIHGVKSFTKNPRQKNSTERTRIRRSQNVKRERCKKDGVGKNSDGVRT